MINTEIEITKKDLEKIIYFILMKFKADPLHRQGTSAKRDLIGGYIERWFNKIAETIVFEKILGTKDYQVISDYFLYANDSDKNAPDILGLEDNSGNIFPFVKYKDGTWESVSGMPRIEVKVVRKDQALLSVREPQMVDDYYVFIESDLNGDYLTSVFEEGIFSDSNFESLSVSESFIESDVDSKIIKPEKVGKTDRIGTMKLLGIYEKGEIRRLFDLCSKDVKPYYFSSAENKDPWRPNSNEKVSLENGSLFRYSYKDEVYLPIPVKIEDGCKIKIIKKNKGSVVIESSGPITIGDTRLKTGFVTINFSKFDRSSSWDENIALKSTVQKLGNDSTEKLVSFLDNLVKK